MSEDRELSGLSELPVDAAYWAALERRVTGELGPRVRALGGEPARPGLRVVAARPAAAWWPPTRARTAALGALAAAAALLVALLPPRTSSDHALTGAAAFLPASGDPAVVAMLGARTPPSIAALVLPAGGAADE